MALGGKTVKKKQKKNEEKKLPERGPLSINKYSSKSTPLLFPGEEFSALNYEPASTTSAAIAVVGN